MPFPDQAQTTKYSSQTKPAVQATVRLRPKAKTACGHRSANLAFTIALEVALVLEGAVVA